jgi:long-chain acyl-CoA synthetase
MSVILYSGGTTGTPKGIMLSDWNFNALTQALNWQLPGGVAPGDKVLSILPLFHGFGLGVTANLFLTKGGCCILVPKFSADEVVKVLLKKKPQIIAGVPTLFEALSVHPKIGKVTFSELKGCFGGGDKVPETVKKRFDEVLSAGGGSVELVEGYGLTETVTACTLLPAGQYRKDSIGVPMPGIRAKVVEPDTTRELPMGEEGELCITGPTNMIGYMNAPEETAETIRRHEDGREWVHTGDLCSMDTDGFIYFKMRLKRMVKVSGIAVYPPQVEETLRQHEAVRDVCVVGVPDPYKMNVIRAYVVPADGTSAGEETAEAIKTGRRTNSTSGVFPRTSSSGKSCPSPVWEKWPIPNWRGKRQRKPQPAEIGRNGPIFR